MTPERRMVVTPVRTVTNFFELYKTKTAPNQHNGIFGHGRERYDSIENILIAAGNNVSRKTAWAALRSAAQTPVAGDVTSNTQWSILYNNTALTAEIVIRRDLDTIYKCDFKQDDVIEEK